MTRWKTETEERGNENNGLGAGGWMKRVRKSSNGFCGGQVTSGYGDVSSSIGDCSSTSGGLNNSSGTSNGTTNGKENEFDFDFGTLSNEAEPTVPSLRNGRTNAAGSVLGQMTNTGVSTSSSDNERPSSSGIPNGHLNRIYQATDFHKDTIGKRSTTNPRSSPSAAAGSVYGGNATYMSNFKGASPVFPNQTINQWNPNRVSSVVEGEHRPPGDVGLLNGGNTCFMNAGLQCLVHTPSLVEYFLKLDLRKASPFSFSVVYEFQAFMQHVWFGISSSICISNFRNKLGEVHAQFKDGRQHDCQEFLALMLDTLHEQLKNVSKYDNNYSKLRKGEALNGVYSGYCFPNKDSISSSDEDQNPQSSVHKRNGIQNEKNRSKPSKRSKLEIIDSDSGPSHVSCELMDIHDGYGDGPESSSQAGLLVKRKRVNDLETGAKKVDDYWREYVANNNTVIASTFQGLFKSTVICGECEYVSVTYEPFMYLSVPIPRVSSRNICVTFIGLKDRRPLKVQVSLMTDETVERLKVLVAKEIPGLSAKPNSFQDFALAEIVNNNIARRLSEEVQISYLNDSDRNIYMYELNDNYSEKYGRYTNMSTLHGMFTNNTIQHPTLLSKSFVTPSYDENWEEATPEREPPPLVPTGAPEASPDPFIGPLPLPSTIKGGNVDTTTDAEGMETKETVLQIEPAITNVEVSEPKQTCIICLEEHPIDPLRKHKVCGAILCVECLQRAASFFEGSSDNDIRASNGSHLKCPTCAVVVSKEEFVSFSSEPSSQLNLVGVLLRLPCDRNNNTTKNSGRLFGAPLVVRIPTALPAEELHSFISQINPFPELDSSLNNVLCDGLQCAHCFPTDRCDGCPVAKEGEISIQQGTALVISYSDISREQIESVEPSDMASAAPTTPTFMASEPIVDIHDCLRSFSEVEHLDEQNPWHCPKCAKNQPATKTMTICRFPDCLIIQLKRFVFIDHMSCKLSNKLRFPLTDLDMNPYIAPEAAGKSNNVYDLYSCVCHYGTTSSGHYVAYSKNPATNAWSYFNDSAVIQQPPSEGEFTTAYVLFYQRKGLIFDIPKRTEETIIRNPPSSITNRPTTAVMVVSNKTLISTSSELNNAWNASSISSGVADSTLSTTLHNNPLEEMNFSAGHTILNNFPHVSSTKRLSDLSLPTEGGGFIPDDGFAEDSFHDVDARDSNVFNDDVDTPSESGFNDDFMRTELNEVSTSTISNPSQWGTMD